VVRKRNPLAKRVEVRPRSTDDLWLDELRADCAKAMVKYLKAGVNIQKPIGSLSQRELEGLAEACNAHWIRRVTERHAALAPGGAGDPAVQEAMDILTFMV
jgi:hypothetical protein